MPIREMDHYTYMLKRIFKTVDFRFLADASLIVLSFWLATTLVGGLAFIRSYPFPIFACFGLTVICRLAIMLSLRTQQIVWRYIAAQDAFRLLLAMGLSTILISAGFYIFRSEVLSPTILILDLFISSYLTIAARLTWRTIYHYKTRAKRSPNARTVLIYGAGRNGVSLARRLSADPHLNLNLVGFIDDDPKKAGKIVEGVVVLGGREYLWNHLVSHKPDELIIAIDEMEGTALREILLQSHKCGIRPKMYLSFDRGEQEEKSEWELLRDVKLYDLLNRPRKKIDLQPLEAELDGNVVLVTGAGGSIGGELCRQLVKLAPAEIVLLDNSEYGLFHATEELMSLRRSQTRITPVLADLKEHEILSRIIEKFKPTVIYHAAAYKHVHLVEQNPSAAVLNNILGTLNICQLAAKNKVEKLVLISTDKAVNPAGIMGATKRICELIVSQIAEQTGLRYSTVRFGNVLLSSGSLVPLLKRQIRNGGPVTITHREMTRYFMLLPEAAELVLKASSISSPGDLNILKMGEPIKIVDIATNLITLLGKKVNEIPIIYTGARPGEKLAEELYLCGDEIKTVCDEILVLPHGDIGATGREFSSRSFNKKVNELIEKARSGDASIGQAVLEFAREFSRTERSREKMAA